MNQHMVQICALRSLAEWAEAPFGILAAAFWFYASWQGRGSFLETPMDQLDRSFRSQARYNAIAAFFAGLAALLQIFVSYAPVCRDFG
jgi:hypothetical protein